MLNIVMGKIKNKYCYRFKHKKLCEHLVLSAHKGSRCNVILPYSSAGINVGIWIKLKRDNIGLLKCRECVRR